MDVPGRGARTGPLVAPRLKTDLPFAKTLTIAAGSTVRWTNHDDIPHNIVSDEKSFKSKVLKTEETFVYTFSKPGTYTYLCGLHPQMTGKIVVQ